MKINMILIYILMISNFNVYSKSNNEHEKKIDFIQKCIENKDNMEEFIKNSDYYNDDCFEKYYNLNFFVENATNFLKHHPFGHFIFTGCTVRYMILLNQYLFEYNIQISDKYGLMFTFTDNGDESCLRAILLSFIGNLETPDKFQLISRFIESVNNNTDSSIIANFFIPEDKAIYTDKNGTITVLNDDKYNNFKIHRKYFEIIKGIIQNNYINNIEMINEIYGYSNATNDEHFYHIFYIKIAEKCILKFEYRYDEIKNLWFFISFEISDTYP